MATPLLAYKFNEASSGTAPTAILDSSAGTALNATITYGVSGAWTSIAAGRGLNYGGTATSVSGSLSGTKVQTALAGSTAVTVEWCIDSALSATTYDSYLEIVDGSSTHVISMTINHSQGGLIFSAAEGAFPNDCLIKCTIPTSGVLVIHVVVDSTQATAGNRVKVYVNGSLQSITIVDQIGLNAALDAGFTWSTATLTMGAVGAAPLGITYEGFIYASALNSTEVSAHATAIAANNDADPNAAAQVPYRRPAPLVTVDEEYTPPRRPRVTASGIAPATFVPYRRPPPFQEPDQQFLFMGMRSATIQSGPGADNPPWGWPRQVLSLFRTTEEDPGRFRRPTVTPSAPAIVPDNPPWGNPRRLLALFRPDEEFQPPPQFRKVIPGGPAVTPNNPPWGWPRRVQGMYALQYVEPQDQAPRLARVTASGPVPPAPPAPTPTQPTNTGPFDWRADYAAIIGQMFRGGSFPFQT